MHARYADAAGIGAHQKTEIIGAGDAGQSLVLGRYELGVFGVDGDGIDNGIHLLEVAAVVSIIDAHTLSAQLLGERGAHAVRAADGIAAAAGDAGEGGHVDAADADKENVAAPLQHLADGLRAVMCIFCCHALVTLPFCK